MNFGKITAEISGKIRGPTPEKKIEIKKKNWRFVMKFLKEIVVEFPKELVEFLKKFLVEFSKELLGKFLVEFMGDFFEKYLP